MSFKLILAAATALLIPTAHAQTGEDHSAKSDVANRAGANGSSGAPNLDPSLGADPNVATSTSSTYTSAQPPRAKASPQQQKKRVTEKKAKHKRNADR